MGSKSGAAFRGHNGLKFYMKEYWSCLFRINILWIEQVFELCRFWFLKKTCIINFTHLEVVKDPKNPLISKSLVPIQNSVSVRWAKLEAAFHKALLYLFCCLMLKNFPSKSISPHCEKSRSYWQECVIAYDNEKELLCCLFGKSFDSEAATKLWTRS